MWSVKRSLYILIERARFALERGNDADARRFANTALQSDGGRCEAMAFRADLARRDGEVALTQSLIPKLLACPGGVSSNILFLRSHLKMTETIPLLRRLLARNPTSSAARRALADALFATGDRKGADQTLWPSITTLWPNETEAYKRFASYRELEGHRDEAESALKRARSIDGGDLTLARALAVGAHADVLGWSARDGLKTIAAFKEADFHLGCVGGASP